MMGSRNNLGRLGLSGALSALLLLPISVRAQGTPPTWPQLVSEGRALADKLCRSCHVTDEKSGTATAGLPSFRGMANRKDQSAERIRNVLINPHPPMPDVQLSRPEIDRLLAYIDSLRENAAGPPLTPRSSPGAKPSYPDPS